MTFDAAENRYATTATGMQYRFTGRSGLQLPVLSLGLWQHFGDHRSAENQRANLPPALARAHPHLALAQHPRPPHGPPPATRSRHPAARLANDAGEMAV